MTNQIIHIEDQLRNQETYLTDLIGRLQRAVEKLPDGSLEIYRRTDGFDYYWIKKGKYKKYEKEYISRANKKLIRNLAQKSYFQKSINEAKRLLQSVRKFMNAYDESRLTEVYYDLSNRRQELIEPLFLSDSDYEKMWRNVEYEGKGGFPDDWDIKSLRGELMRSKSEVVIASMLDKYNVPYRYEYPLIFDGRIQYPDFLILNKRTRQEYIWEHFGKMGDEDYAGNCILKINTFAKNGYFQGINLIFTMETKERHTDMDTYERYIKEYLL